MTRAEALSSVPVITVSSIMCPAHTVQLLIMHTCPQKHQVIQRNQVKRGCWKTFSFPSITRLFWNHHMHSVNCPSLYFFHPRLTYFVWIGDWRAFLVRVFGLTAEQEDRTWECLLTVHMLQLWETLPIILCTKPWQINDLATCLYEFGNSDWHCSPVSAVETELNLASLIYRCILFCRLRKDSLGVTAAFVAFPIWRQIL